MNFDLKVQIPLKDLVDSLVSCGDLGRHAISAMTPLPVQTDVSSTRSSPEKQRCGSDSKTPVRESASSQQPAYCSIPFPRIDSPYRAKGRWRSNSATYFLRDHKIACAGSKRELCPNAPVFTPLTFSRGSISSCGSEAALPAGSPYAECSVGGSDALWELPGLPSPLIESMQEPSVGMIPQDPPAPPLMTQSILQRGLSNHQCRQM
jgi:hypothetical protein